MVALRGGSFRSGVAKRKDAPPRPPDGQYQIWFAPPHPSHTWTLPPLFHPWLASASRHFPLAALRIGTARLAACAEPVKAGSIVPPHASRTSPTALRLSIDIPSPPI